MKNIVLRLKFIFFFFLICSVAQSQPNFQTGIDLYKAGNYKGSIENFEDILDKGQQSSELYYNLGNAYLKIDNLGKAILNYEKAKVLDSSSKEIEQNLLIAKERVGGEIVPLKPFFLSAIWRSVGATFSSTTWSFLSIIIFWIAAGGFMMWLLAAERERKKLGFVVGVIALVLSFLPFFLGLSKASLEQDSKRGVLVVEQPIYLKSGPDQKSTDILKIYDGTTFQLLDQIQSWYKLRLEDGEVGWLPISSVEKI